MKLAIYVHIPFCKSKCLYCDFYSIVSDRFEDYLFALLKEVELYKKVLEESEVETVYFGGGTPSVVPPSFLLKVLESLARFSKRFAPSEVTVEVNPESIDQKKLKTYKKIGINRISLGVQSCDDDVLKKIGRLYNEKTLRKKADIVLSSFENVNFDFILGLPGETDRTLDKNLKFLEKFTPQHTSLYFLEIDEGTRLFNLLKKKIVVLPDEEEVEKRHDIFVEFLKRKEFKRYEISNFSKPGMESQHNLFYWRNWNYLGLGASAGGHIGKERYTNVSDIKKYAEMVNRKIFPREYYHVNSEKEEALETIFMGLRTIEGVDLKRVKILLPLIERLQEKYTCYVKVKNDKIFLSERGMDYSKKIFSDLIEWYQEGEK
ncbi:radical SAM family heme chaperone HemW [Thermotoga sp. KOL6]|uniref:radical SAM family heme chaperone HemW n=1 Tax=Thermotoga sp. KOL6 TaxID=126741 RepID=UPI000C768AB1|nr:radical SAM family heme chaperone HemW [Thermotoga sp. KOL6]PLV59889.1 coproporphyrinogen III oxidase [Thermotoga sp. KOL6]